MGTETWWFQKLFEFVFVVTIDITMEILRELFISSEYFCVLLLYLLEIHILEISNMFCID